MRENQERMSKNQSIPHIDEHDQIGIVKWFSEEKGFGFIKRSTGEDDVFVHRAHVDGGLLKTGEQVRCDVTVGDKGPRAVNVVRA